ncbi:hypothetical protein OUZ56_023319 [Daphnia magna]|uniref:Uncharacterized protein n=1 Tax=Daphnia magna TaxID=35525 RepID=A0ABR0AYV6_9CRUS|nr:hypothetical protein OUZ56_023319 [Daphnia magna]
MIAPYRQIEAALMVPNVNTGVKMKIDIVSIIHIRGHSVPGTRKKKEEKCYGLSHRSKYSLCDQLTLV